MTLLLGTALWALYDFDDVAPLAGDLLEEVTGCRISFLSVNLDLSRDLFLAVEGLKISTGQSGTLVSGDSVEINVAFAPLLEHRVVVRRVLLENVIISFPVKETPPPEEPPSWLSLPVPSWLSLEKVEAEGLRVRHGRTDLHFPRIALYDISSGRKPRIAVDAEAARGSVEIGFSAVAQIDASDTGMPMKALPLELEMDVRSLEIRNIGLHLPDRVARIRVAGDLDRGVRISVSSDQRVRQGLGDDRFVLIAKPVLEGFWSGLEDPGGITDVAFRSEGISLNGDLAVSGNTGVEIRKTDIAVSPQRSREMAGEVGGDAMQEWIGEADIRLTGLSGVIGKRTSLDGDYTLVAGQRLASGKISVSRDSHLRISLRGDLDLEGSRLGPLKERGWKINGTTPILFSLTDRHMQIRGDLSKSELEYGTIFSKQEGMPLAADIPVVLDDTGSISEGFSVSGFPADALGNFRYDRKERKFTLEMEVNDLQLGDVGRYVSFAEEYQLSGEADAQVRVIREAEGKPVITITGATRRAGAIIPGGAIAPLSRMNARFRTDTESLEFWQGTGWLGSEPVSFSGRIASLRDMGLAFDLAARRVRASDLFFKPDDLYLRDVRGHFDVSTQGIVFSEVFFKLGDGDATISGVFDDFRNPVVTLDIRSGVLNIDQAIELFSSGSSQEEPDELEAAGGEPSPGRVIPVTADLAVNKGIFGPLGFSDATGLLHYDDSGIQLSPLRLSCGNGGRLNGSVYLTAREDDPRPLKLAGELEGADLAVLYAEILKSESLVTGRISGDYYLESDTGDGFWGSLQGGTKVKIDRGVIKKFSMLAKVFSLLNVSQIFSLKLPDMAKDGMPFDSIEGSLSFEKGIMHTEDLVVKSRVINISMVGDMNMVTNEVDFLVGVQPLQAVDKIVTKIPVAGWILGGEEKAVVTTHFKVTGNVADPRVDAVPVSSLSGKVLGIFQRVFQLPHKLATGVGDLFKKEDEEKEGKTPEVPGVPEVK